MKCEKNAAYIVLFWLVWFFCAAASGNAGAQTRTQVGDKDRTQFEDGSHIAVSALSETQVANLLVLAKVWGFLKYHHPAVTSGARRWDDDLLLILPKILQAPDRAAADARMREWVTQLGPIGACNPCTELRADDLYAGPELGWMHDATLGAALRGDLQRVYDNRKTATEQYYVSLTTIGNPVFNHEADYKTMPNPDAGFQLLALFRLWNIVAYWAPYRDQVDGDWNEVLRQSIRPVALANDRAAYALAMLAVIARIRDSHANLWSSLALRPPVGNCSLPAVFRFIEDRVVVAALAQGEESATAGLRVGDVVEALDGTTVAALVEQWLPFYAASNRPTQLRDLARGLGAGDCGAVRLLVSRDGVTRELGLRRVPMTKNAAPPTHDRPGETFQLLADDIAYIKLSSIKRVDVADYMQKAASTKGLVIDIRNYPADFVPFALGQYFIDKPTQFVRFTVGDIDNPGAFYWGPQLALGTLPAHYAGKVMILVDEVSQSQAEYTAMALRVGARAKVVGSTTAGADGNVSWIALPGGLRTMISGLGVFYPDKRPTQRIGIVADIAVRPTIRGIREGRDEVLDAAIAEIRRAD